MCPLVAVLAPSLAQMGPVAPVPSRHPATGRAGYDGQKKRRVRGRSVEARPSGLAHEPTEPSSGRPGDPEPANAIDSTSRQCNDRHDRWIHRLHEVAGCSRSTSSCARPSDAPADLYRKWGVLPGPWLWATHLRILFVLDGRIDTGRTSGCFGLGLVLDTLRDNSFAWWVRFEVDVVRRDDGTQRLCAPDSPDENPASLNFRFTNVGFDIDEYDQIWFFGDFPSNEPNNPDDARYSPLSDSELKVARRWMNRGGGVFGTGDHSNLGASMCSRIPRVRSMRKWTAAQGVPPQHGPERHETTQGAPGTTTTYAEEEDAVPQTIEPVYRPTAMSIAILTYVPHPLLCARDGVIDKFPDHMHEGEVIIDDAVQLDQPLGIPGYAGADIRPPPIPAAASSTAGRCVRPNDAAVAARGRAGESEAVPADRRLRRRSGGDRSCRSRLDLASLVQREHPWPTRPQSAGLRAHAGVLPKRRAVAGDARAAGLDALRVCVGRRRLGSDGVPRWRSAEICGRSVRRRSTSSAARRPSARSGASS